MVRSYSEVKSEIEYFEGELVRLREEAKQAQARELPEVRKQIASIMKEHGITAADLLNSMPNDKTKLSALKKDGEPRPRKQPEPQYKDPNSDKTWTGQGRCPTWMKDQDRENFRIQKAA